MDVSGSAGNGDVTPEIEAEPEYAAYREGISGRGFAAAAAKPLPAQAEMPSRDMNDEVKQ